MRNRKSTIHSTQETPYGCIQQTLNRWLKEATIKKALKESGVDTFDDTVFVMHHIYKKKRDQHRRN